MLDASVLLDSKEKDRLGRRNLSAIQWYFRIAERGWQLVHYLLMCIVSMEEWVQHIQSVWCGFITESENEISHQVPLLQTDF